MDHSIMSDVSDLAWGAHLESVKIHGFWRSYQFSWHINRKELKAAFLALKFLIPNRTNVHVQICIDNRTAVAYVNHLGATRPPELNSITVKMWAWCLEKNMFLSALYLPGIMNKIADLLSTIADLLSVCLQNASFRHVRIHPQSPSSKIFFMDSGSTSCGNGRVLSKLEQRSPLHVSSLQSDSKMSSENNQRQGNCSFINTNMAVKTMVSYATKSPIRQTSSITTQSTNIETAMVSSSTSSISEQEVWSSRLAFARRFFKDQNFSERVCKILQAS